MSRYISFGKFDFFAKQPSYIRYSVYFILLIALAWLVLRACSSSAVPEKTFRIAYDRTWYPLPLMNKGKNMSAFVDTLLMRIAEEQKLRIHAIETGPGLFEGLETGAYDGVVSAFSPPTTRPSSILYSDIFYRIGPTLVVESDSDVDSLDDMSGKTVGVVDKSISLIVKDYPSIVFINYDNASSALADVDNNRIDGVIVDILVAKSYILGLYSGRLKIATHPFTEEGLRIVMLKDRDSERFMEHFNKGLKKLIDSGEFIKLLKEWRLIDTEFHPDSEESPEAETPLEKVPEEEVPPPNAPQLETPPASGRDFIQHESMVHVV